MDPVTIAVLVGAALLLFGKKAQDTGGSDVEGSYQMDGGKAKTGPDTLQAGDDGGYDWPIEVKPLPTYVPFEELFLDLRTFDIYSPSDIENSFSQDTLAVKLADLKPGSNPHKSTKHMMDVDVFNRNGELTLLVSVANSVVYIHEDFAAGFHKNVKLPPLSQMAWHPNGGYGKRTLLDTYVWPKGQTKTAIVLDVTHLTPGGIQ